MGKKISFWTIAIVMIVAVSTSAGAGDRIEARGSYSKSFSGFYLGHFDRMKDLADPQCARFAERVLRGGAPDAKNLDAFRRRMIGNDVALVVDLRAERGGAAVERNLLNAAGATYVNLPLKTSGSDQASTLEVEVSAPAVAGGKHALIQKIKMEKVQATLFVMDLVEDVLSDASGRAVYFHCQRGEDRTGMFLALLRRCEVWSREFKSYGGVMYAPLKAHYENVRKAMR